MFFLCKKKVSEDLTMFDLILIWHPSNVRFDDFIRSNDVNFNTYAQNDPESICRTPCLWLLFYSDFLWPDLDLFKHVLRTYAMLFKGIWQRLQYELFAAHLDDQRVQNVKTLHFDFRHYIDLTCDLNPRPFFVSRHLSQCRGGDSTPLAFRN